MNRREFVTGLTLGAMGTAAGVRAEESLFDLVPTSSGNYSQRAKDLIASCNVIDMLAPIAPVGNVSGIPLMQAWLEDPDLFRSADAQAYFDAGTNVYALGPVLPDDPDSEWAWFDNWNRFITANQIFFQRIDTADQLEYTYKSGKIGIMLTLQSSFHFRELDDVNDSHRYGQRVGQLCHNQGNHLASGCFDDDDNGLSDFGAEVVERMQAVGMAVDVSHCSDKSTYEALEIATQPVLFTHAPCRALNKRYARAKTDDMIKKMAATGGVMGIAVLRFFARDREPVTIEHFLDHIDHVVEIAGIEHVGIGSDQGFDSEDQLPFETRKAIIEGAPAKYKVHTNIHYQIAIEGINHRKRMFDITEGLISRGYSDDHIKLILGGNFRARATRGVGHRLNRRRFLVGASIGVGAAAVGTWYWPRRWEYIIVHHSAGNFGTIEFLQQVHRNRQPGDPIDAIPYHYVIGNGNGLGMGEVASDWRRDKNIWGTHLSANNRQRNFLGLGICLIGNFEEHPVPEGQFESLIALTKSLMNQYDIPRENVTGHGLVDGESTQCPGRYFPINEFRQAIA